MASSPAHLLQELLVFWRQRWEWNSRVKYVDTLPEHHQHPPPLERNVAIRSADELAHILQHLLRSWTSSHLMDLVRDVPLGPNVLVIPVWSHYKSVSHWVEAEGHWNKLVAIPWSSKCEKSIITDLCMYGIMLAQSLARAHYGLLSLDIAIDFTLRT